jgi:hypothetical protein
MRFDDIRVCIIPFIELIEVILGAVTEADVKTNAILRTSSDSVVKLQFQISHDELIDSLIHREVCKAADTQRKPETVLLLLHNRIVLVKVRVGELVDFDLLREPDCFSEHEGSK